MKITLSKNFPAARILSALALCGGLLASAALAQDAVQPTAVTAPLPAGIQPGSPLSQVVKLAQAGVDEGIIQAYVTNSTGTFNLDSDKIIYLKDTGIPTDLVMEMIQHDTGLQAQIAATAPPPPPATDTPPAPIATAADNSQPPPPDQPVDTQSDPAVPPAMVGSVNDFDAALSPYGTWTVVGGYGRCWLPGVAVYNHDWQPYGDHGRWVSTDSGWYWTSDYSWGWAPFHYGRWFRSPQFGWCWQPDTVWGPSWVTWRYSDDYCGWAPLPPGAYYGDAGFIYDGNAVGDDFDFGLDADCFIFVATANFCDPYPYRHRLDRNLAGQVYHHSTIINSYQHGAHGLVNRGIDPGRITQATHVPIHTIPLHAESGVAGRFPASEPPRRNPVATYVNRAPSTSVQNYRPGVVQNPAQNREAQPYNWQTQQRFNAPAPVQNRFNPLPPVQRSYAPGETYRPVTPPPDFRPVPPRPDFPSPESRTEPPPAQVERPERVEPAPAPARNSAPASEPARSGNNSNQKTYPH